MMNRATPLLEQTKQIILEALAALEGADGPAARWVCKEPRPRIGRIPAIVSSAYGGGDAEARGEALVRSGAALELLYHSAAVFDDIQDQSESRGGRRSAWSVHGTGQAINIGVRLLAAANLAIVASEGALPDSLRLEAAEALDLAVGELSRGQWQDLSADRPDLTDCLTCARKKTGELIAVALQLGGIAAGIATERKGLLMEAGRRLGEALQLHDDLEDLLEEDGACEPAWTSVTAALFPQLPIEEQTRLLAALDAADAQTFSRIQLHHGAAQIAMALADVSVIHARKLFREAGLPNAIVDALLEELRLKSASVSVEGTIL
jgi:hypothetical protein